MSTETINGREIRQIVDRLRRRGNAAVQAAKQALREGVNGIVDDAKLRVPVDTGRLKNSIHAETENEGASYKIVADAKNEQGNSYAKIVEYDPKINKPFMYPAIEANKQRISDKIKQAIERSVH